MPPVTTELDVSCISEDWTNPIYCKTGESFFPIAIEKMLF